MNNPHEREPNFPLGWCLRCWTPVDWAQRRQGEPCDSVGHSCLRPARAILFRLVFGRPAHGFPNRALQT